MAKRSVPLRPHVQDALQIWGQMVRRGRAERGWSAKELAARANVSEQTVLAAEAGQRGTAIGTMLELADLAGVPIFGIEDRAELAIRRQRGEELLALMPRTIRKSRSVTVDDNF